MEASLSNLERVAVTLSDTAANLALRIIAALVLYFAGRFVIKKIIKWISGMKGIEKIDDTARGYIITFVKAVLYIVLIVCIVAQLGVPMSSVVALLATAGAAVGLALQGALSNFAGGLMLLVFRPFKVDDYIISGDNQGYVQSISLVYTTLRTFDNRTVLIPNGTLMNSNIVNTTANDTRRVDISFDIAASEPSDRVRAVMMDVIKDCSEVKAEPEPAVALSGTVPGGITYTVRAWAATADYWAVYEGLTESIASALNEAGIPRPAVAVDIRQ